MSRIDLLHNLHDEFNDKHFGNKLNPITLLIRRNRTKDGYYEYRAHKDWTPIRQELWKACISISEGCFQEGTVEGTLLHEMIHQYQCEVLDVAPHHDEVFNSFARKLEREYTCGIR